MAKRHKTNYPGVFYRLSRRIGGTGTEEKIFYVVYKKGGRIYEEKAGRQFSDRMTPVKAAGIRLELIEGKRLSKKEMREQQHRPEKRPWTVERLWEKYKEQKPDLKGLASDQSRFGKYIKPAFGSKEPKDLIPLDTDRLRLDMSKKLSAQTVKLVLELLIRVCNFGVEKNLSKPLSFTVQKPKVNNVKTEDLSAAEFKSLFQSIENDSHPTAGGLMKFALYSGLRRSELFRLKWSDINFGKGYIKLRETKTGIDQTIPLSKNLRELLEDIREQKNKSEFVFPGRNGKMITDVTREVNRIRDAAGLPKSFRALHGLRHAYASTLASSGRVGLFEIQKLLRHRDAKTTLRYAHLRNEALKRASDIGASLIDEAFKSKDAAGLHEVK